MKKMVPLFEQELIVKEKREQFDLWSKVKSRLEIIYGVGNVDIEHMLTFFSRPYLNPSELSPNVIYHYEIDAKDTIQVVDPKTSKSLVATLKEFIYRSCDIEDHTNLLPIYSKFWKSIN